ncbi:ADP-glyceromanno-heptose 6-epimerase [Pyruvatibacter sp.]|uniref:ADP-glyceromanno-heptose 6-epimerase n=1 Tax=Pyruvatibacter sp. TaxID=1981328 RepID=UPI0032EFCEF2
MIIVTGGAGFIGSNVLAHLSESRRSQLVVCDWLESGDKWRNIASSAIDDVIAPEALARFLDDNADAIEAVIHMGAISSTTETDVDLIVRSNIRLTNDIWDWCTRTQTPFIYASSAATYGNGEAGFDDDMSVDALRTLAPLNAYGWSKHLVDQRIARRVAAGDRTPPQWAGLKFFNVYGPNEYHKGGQKSVVAHIHPAASAGETVKLFRSHNPAYEDGGQLRDFVYVKDCAAIIAWLLDTPSVSGLFNVGTGEARSFKDLATAVFAALNRTPDISYVDTPVAIRDKYQYFTQADMQRLRAAGYTGTPTSLEDGVAEYVRSYLETDNPYR